MSNPKILVCAPTNRKKQYAESEYFSRILNLSYPNYDVMLCDNSNDREYYQHLRRTYPGISLKYVNPKGKINPEYIAESHEACRQFAIGGNYDFIMHIESDVIVPFNIIELLIQHNKPICGASYFIDHGKESHLMIQLEGSLNNEEKFVYEPKHAELSFLDGSVKPVHSIGLGCVLINRAVFTQIPFRYMKGIDAYADSFFAYDVKTREMEIFVDTSFTVEHRNRPAYMVESND